MSSKALFSKNFPVLKIQDEDKKTVELNVTIETAHTLKKEIILRLTDERDQFFFYQLRMNEQDFQSLKSQQGLLIDFGSFPDMVIELLHKCYDKNTNENHKNNLVFTVMGGCGLSRSGHLAFIETNNFKQLNHLTLEFHPGTDNDVKNYFLENLNVAKDNFEKLQRKSELIESELKSKLRSCEESLQRKTTELSDLKLEMEKKVTEMKFSFEKDLENVKNTFSTTSKEAEQTHKHTVQQLDSKINNLEKSLKRASDEASRYESQINEMKFNLAHSEEKLNNFRNENSTLKKKLSLMESDFGSCSKELADVKTRLAVAEHEINEKKESNKILRDKAEVAIDLNRKLEKDLELKAKELDQQKEVEEKLLLDKTRANKLIRQYQEDNKSLNGKVKNSTQIINVQDCCLKGQQEQMTEMKKELEDAKIEIRNKETEVDRLLKENKTLLSELESFKVKYEENKKALDFITKKDIEKDMSAHMAKPQSLTNCSNNASHYRDFRNLNGPNNIQPVTCEDLIDRKYLRKSSDDPPLQEFRQTSAAALQRGNVSNNSHRITLYNNNNNIPTNQQSSRIPSNLASESRPVRGLPAADFRAPQINGAASKAANTPPVLSSYFGSKPA